MLDADRVLPLVVEYSEEASAQRNADLERIAPLIEAVVNLVRPGELLEWQGKQGGCNFNCNSKGRLHHERHSNDCRLVIVRAALATLGVEVNL